MDNLAVSLNIFRTLSIQFGLKHHPFTLSNSKLLVLMHQNPDSQCQTTDSSTEGRINEINIMRIKSQRETTNVAEYITQKLHQQ